MNGHASPASDESNDAISREGVAAATKSNQLPPKLSEELGAAIRAGRKQVIDRLLIGVSETGNEQLAGALSGLADNYRYDAMLQLLEEKC